MIYEKNFSKTFVYKITENSCPLRHFPKFIQTQKRHHTSLDKKGIPTWILHVIHTKILRLMRWKFVELTLCNISHICPCKLRETDITQRNKRTLISFSWSKFLTTLAKWSLNYSLYTIKASLRKIPKFHLIPWCGNFEERHSFHIVSGKCTCILWIVCTESLKVLKWNLYGFSHTVREARPLWIFRTSNPSMV